MAARPVSWLLLGLGLCLGTASAYAVDLDAGDLIATDTGAITHIDGVTGQRTVLTAGYNNFFGVALRGDEIYASGYSAGVGAVWRIDPATGQVTLLSSGGLLGVLAEDIDLEATGDLVASAWDSVVTGVVRIDPATGAQESASALNMNVYGVAVGPDAHLYVSRRSVFPNRLVRIRPVTTIAWQQNLLFASQVNDVEIGPDGGIFVSGGGSVARVDPVTRLESLTPIAFDSIPYHFHADADGSLLVPGTFQGVEGLFRADPTTGAAVLVSPHRGIDVVAVRPCADRFDNDGDGLLDYPADPGCTDALDPDEGAACGDGVDNDGDGLADYPADPGCDDAADASERSPSLPCDDGADNDGDLAFDYPQDVGCSGLLDADETSPTRVCDNGLDDDGDGLADVADDPGCGSADSSLENPRCQNGFDDDGDGTIDFDGGASLNGGVAVAPPDAACTTASRNKESLGGCGLGFELIALLALLPRLRRADGAFTAPRRAAAVL
jgi:hypothetical protein